MKRRAIRAAILGIASAASALAAAAATISSPYRSTSSTAIAKRLTVPGQEALDLDHSALAALRAAEGEVRIEAFPVAPGALRTLVLKRFEVATVDARVTVSGPDGERSLPFPSIAHFAGRLEDEAGSSVYLSAQSDALFAYVRRAGGEMTYVGPAGREKSAEFVARSGDSPANELPLEPWSCATEELPAALTEMAEPSFPAPRAALAGMKQAAALAGMKQAAVRVETDWEMLTKFPVPGSSPVVYDPNALAAWVATLYGAINVVYERDLNLHL